MNRKPIRNRKTKPEPDKETESRLVSYKLSISDSNMSASTAERSPNEVSSLSLKNQGLKTNGAYQLSQKIKVNHNITSSKKSPRLINNINIERHTEIWHA